MSTTAPQTPSKRVALRNVVIDFVHVDAPWAKRGEPEDKKKYTLTPIVPKNHPQVKELMAAADAAAAEKWGAKYNTQVFPIHCIRDTDLPTELKKKNAKGYGPGVLFFNASRKPKDGPPQVRHPSVTEPGPDGRPRTVQLNMATNPDIYPYAGCVADVVVDFWAYDGATQGHGQRICCDLAVVVKKADGDRLSGNGGDPEEAVDLLIAAPAEEV